MAWKLKSWVVSAKLELWVSPRDFLAIGERYSANAMPS